MTDISKLRREQSWEVATWCEAIHLPAAVASTVLDHLCALEPQLSVLSEAEHPMYIFAEKRELSKYVYGETTQKKYARAQERLAAGKGTILGDMILASPMRHDARLCSLIADHARQIGKPSP